MITALLCGTSFMRHVRYRLSSRIGTMYGVSGLYAPIAIDRRSACLYVRLKCLRDSGPTRAIPVYRVRSAITVRRPFGLMFGSFSSSPRIFASSSSVMSTSSRCSPGRSPAAPIPSPWSPPATGVPTSPSPWPTPLFSFFP